MSDDDSLANSSLSTSRVPPQDGQKADSMPTTRTLPGNDQQEGLEKTGAGGSSPDRSNHAKSGAPGAQRR